MQVKRMHTHTPVWPNGLALCYYSIANRVIDLAPAFVYADMYARVMRNVRARTAAALAAGGNARESISPGWERDGERESIV